MLRHRLVLCDYVGDDPVVCLAAHDLLLCLVLQGIRPLQLGQLA